MSYTYNGNYSGRVLVYPDQVPYDTDILRSNQYRMVDVSNLAQAVLGLPSTVGGSFPSFCSGICTQNASPNMTVEVGVCTLYQSQNMEPVAYGNLGPITGINIYKQASNMSAFNSSTLGTISAPSSGNWVYYLIQGTFNTAQINNVNRPYYNASNPPSPNFQSNYDTEIDNITFALVAGTPSSKSGALPAIPSPTGSGVGMFLILVSDTTTSITNSLISGYPGTFIGTTLTQMPSAVQNQKFSFAIDSGSANAYVAAVSPTLSAYAQGQSFEIQISNANTGASTLNLNGLGAINIVQTNGSALYAGALLSGMIAKLAYNGTNFELLNAAPAAPNVQVLTGSGTYTTPVGALYLKVRGAGGGGGGSGSGTSGQGAGGNGGNTTFGGITANGGVGATAAGLGGAGGTCSGATINYSGQNGGFGQDTGATTNIDIYPGTGGNTVLFGGGGQTKANLVAGAAGQAATGGGGGGAVINANIASTSEAGGGGGAGGSFESFISSPSATYSYSIGSGGAGGTAGTNGYAGGAGGNGTIIVEAYYQ